MPARLLLPAFLIATLFLVTSAWTSHRATLEDEDRTPAPKSVAESDAREFQVDAVHSSVIFKIKHLDVCWFYGRFNKISGSFRLDASATDKSYVNIEIPTDSVDTNNGRRDRDIKSQSFMAASQFPTISFKSTKVAGGAGGKFKITGDLTFRGKTQTINLEATNTGSGEVSKRRGYLTGFECTFTFKRSDFGMTAMLRQKMLGDEIRMMVSLEGSLKK